MNSETNFNSSHPKQQTSSFSPTYSLLYLNISTYTPMLDPKKINFDQLYQQHRGNQNQFNPQSGYHYLTNSTSTQLVNKNEVLAYETALKLKEKQRIELSTKVPKEQQPPNQQLPPKQQSPPKQQQPTQKIQQQQQKPKSIAQGQSVQQEFKVQKPEEQPVIPEQHPIRQIVQCIGSFILSLLQSANNMYKTAPPTPLGIKIRSSYQKYHQNLFKPIKNFYMQFPQVLAQIKYETNKDISFYKRFIALNLFAIGFGLFTSKWSKDKLITSKMSVMRKMVGCYLFGGAIVLPETYYYYMRKYGTDKK